MKITKKQLQEMVRKEARKQLQEQIGDVTGPEDYIITQAEDLKDAWDEYEKARDSGDMDKAYDSAFRLLYVAKELSTKEILRAAKALVKYHKSKV